MKNLKLLIRELGRDKLGNLTKRANEAFGYLCEKQKVTLSQPSEVSIQRKLELMVSVHVASLEEDFLKKRAKLHWLDVEDQNNKTFHRAIKTRQDHNLIREIRCSNGILVTTHSDIKHAA